MNDEKVFFAWPSISRIADGPFLLVLRPSCQIANRCDQMPDRCVVTGELLFQLKELIPNSLS